MGIAYLESFLFFCSLRSASIDVGPDYSKLVRHRRMSGLAEGGQKALIVEDRGDNGRTLGECGPGWVFGQQLTD